MMVAAFVELVSKNITDSPGAILVIPVSGTADVNVLELSSTFHPVISNADVP
jgi:hypothetical protein